MENKYFVDFTETQKSHELSIVKLVGEDYYELIGYSDLSMNFELVHIKGHILIPMDSIQTKGDL
jgi:hypothetical protein